MEMVRVENLKFVVALRTNIFRQLDYGSQQFGPQEEKIAGMVLPLRWTKNDLRALMESRVEAASIHYRVKPPMTLAGLLPNVNVRRGDPLDFIFERTMLRPRDVITYLNAAIQVAEGPRRLSHDLLREAELPYSEERLRALRDEWRDPYVGIDRVFEVFRGAPADMDIDALGDRLSAVALLLDDPTFSGAGWLGKLTWHVFEDGADAKPWAYRFSDLTKLLYDVGILGFAASKNERIWYSNEVESDTRGQPLDVTFQTRFVVHPAFRPALAIKPQYES